MDERELNELVKNVFNGIAKNYRQKLVYTLLNAVKSGDRGRFYWNIARTLNANIDNPDVEAISEKLSRITSVGSEEFERMAYAVIFGILAAGGE